MKVVIIFEVRREVETDLKGISQTIVEETELLKSVFKDTHYTAGVSFGSVRKESFFTKGILCR